MHNALYLFEEHTIRFFLELNFHFLALDKRVAKFSFMFYFNFIKIIYNDWIEFFLNISGNILIIYIITNRSHNEELI